MTRNDETIHEIRQALDRETERRFDAGQLGRALASRGRFTAWSSDPGRRGAGPFGRLPVAVQWVGLAAALVGAALGIRSFYLEQTRGSWVAPPQTATAVPPQVPPGAGAATSNPSAAPAPTLHDDEPEPPAPEPKPVRKAPAKPKAELIAESTAKSPEPSGAPPAEAAPAPTAEGGAMGTTVGQLVNPGAATPDEGAGASPQPMRVTAVFPGIAAVGTGGVDASQGGVRVLSARAGGRPVRAEVREAPEVGATLVVLPAVTAFSALRGDPRRRERALPNVVPAAFFAGDEPAGRVFGPKDETVPGDGTGVDPAAPAPAGGAYYVRLFIGSGFEPAVPQSQGLMGDGLRVIPLREQEVWGDEEQESFLAKNFRLTSITAVDGARIEPDETQVAESTFVAGVGGQVMGVAIHAAPGEADATHRIDVRLFRTDGRPGDPAEGSIILSASLLVDTGRIVVLGIPEPETAVHARRGPRVAFLALSPRFGSFEPSHGAEQIQTITGDVEPPVLVEKTQPVYNQEALDQRAEGKVVLRVVIRKDGEVDGIQVLRVPQVPGGEYLMEAAARAVREWRYLPARLHGEPVNVYFTVVVNFALNRGDGT